MDVVRFAVENPVKVAVGVILVALFGLISIVRIPIQLTPNVDRPFVNVSTVWPGAAAQEIEREIVDRQEEKLKVVTGLKKLTSVSREGIAQVTLEFYVGTDKDDAKREVSDSLRQVTGYPLDVEEPVIQAGSTGPEGAIAWLIFRCEPGRDVTTLYDFLDDNVKSILSRIEGVAAVDIYGGREREVQVRVDPYRLAARGITMQQLAAALRNENLSVSAGTVEQGKRDYTYRTVGQYEHVEDVLNTVVAREAGGPVYVHDVADVISAHTEARAFVRSLGDNCLAMPVQRETGANVMQVMADLRRTIDMINEEVLAPRGWGMSLKQVYDETVYIQSAIDLVVSNLVYGGILAIVVLIVFLRSASATFIVAVSIPISVIGTFLAVSLLGRSLNVVMLAGMAFAVGLVVDNAIVVLENIFRHRQMGKSRFAAAVTGGVEVWGAILISTLTTMAVFIPVVFVEEEAGQLFRDIAIAISCGVGLSLLVSILVIPALANKALRTGRDPSRAGHEGGRIASAVAGLVERVNRSVLLRLGIVIGFTALSLLGSWLLMPPTDYLPTGNKNLVFGFMIPAPGYGIDEFHSIANKIENPSVAVPVGLRSYWEAELGSPEAAALPPVMMQSGGEPGKPESGRMVPITPPPIGNYFYGTFRGRAFMGCTSQKEGDIKPLLGVFRRATSQIAGVFPFFFQTSLFGGLTGGNTVEIEIRGTDLDDVVRAGGMLFGHCIALFPGAVQPDPGNFALARDEVQAVPDRVKAADVGLTVQDVGFLLETFVDGALVGGFREAGDEIDLVLMVDRPPGATREQIGAMPIYTPTGRIVPLASVVELRRTTAPEEIKHIEEMPAVSLTVRAPEGEALGSVMGRIQREVIDPMVASGMLPPTVLPPRLAGNADKLVETFDAIKWNLLLALLITYLLMAALFESFVYPFVIMFSVPLATVGGFAALRIVHWLSTINPVTPIQNLDVLTMLGFIILIGIVVNNAILLVHQALNNMRDAGMKPHDAIRESVRTRVRPIFMSALTSIFGMLPLVVMPGAGSELYRGLGAVVVGGLLVSTAFTLVLVPALFSLCLDVRDRVFGRPFAEEEAPVLQAS